MTTTTAPVSNLHDLLNHEVRKFTIAETLLSKALQRWIGEAVAFPLKKILQKYADDLRIQLEMLERYIREEEIDSVSLHNRIMQAFIDETRERLEDCGDPEVKDACLLASIQEINHYKISAYGSAAAFAKTISMPEMARLFHDAEMQEKEIDQELSLLAEKDINLRARAPIVLPA